MKLKKVVSAVLLVALLVTYGAQVLPVRAEAKALFEKGGSCGENVVWKGTADSFLLTISGTGPMGDFGQEWETVRNYPQVLVVTEGVTSIAGGAFADCRLNMVTLAGSVTAIGEAAFKNCTALPEIVVPDSVTVLGSEAFAGCTAAASITVGEQITHLPGGVFADCTGVTSVVLPAGLESIGESAFAGCTSLESVYFAGTEDQWQEVSIASGNDCLTDAQFSCKQIAILQSGSFNSGVSWKFDELGTLTVYGNGFVEDPYDEMSLPWYTWRDDIKKVVIKDGVQNICANMFYDCNNVTEVSIPDSVTSLGDWAFNSCDSLAQVTVPGSVAQIGFAAFYNCIGLMSVTLQEGVAYIAQDVFYGCGNLTAVTLPITLEEIGPRAFMACNSLSEITIPAGITTIKSNVFYNCTGMTSVAIPQSVTLICEGAFEGCSRLESVYYGGTMAQWNQITVESWNDSLLNADVYTEEDFSGECGENLTWELDENGKLTISGTGAMTDFESYEGQPWWSLRSQIKTVEAAEGVTTLGDYAFCSNALKTVSLPQSLTAIGDNAFNCCENLETVAIPAGVTVIGETAFAECYQLTGIWVEAQNQNYCSDSKGVLFNKDKTQLLQAPSVLEGAYTIPATVTGISQFAFTCVKGLTELAIPNGITQISGMTFYFCGDLQTVRLPVSLTRIGDGAFYGCENISDVYYAGTQEQWDAVTVGIYNEGIEGATVHVHTHSFTNYVSNNDATCTADGTKTATCSCGVKDTQPDAGSKKGHTFGNWVVIKKPTTSATGIEQRKCSVCGATEERSVAKLALNGWQLAGGKWYYYKNNVKQTGWLKDGGVWYYFNTSGVMQTGWQKLGGVWYYFHSSGAMQTGWQKLGGVWYYFHSSGAMATGWLYQGGVWYYFNTSGAMQTGWLYQGGTWYYFKSGGAMQTGWLYQGGVWYYFKSSGAMQTGWLYQGGVWYYFKSGGAMVTGSLAIGGKVYRFNASGACLNP